MVLDASASEDRAWGPAAEDSCAESEDRSCELFEDAPLLSPELSDGLEDLDDALSWLDAEELLGIELDSKEDADEEEEEGKQIALIPSGAGVPDP